MDSLFYSMFPLPLVVFEQEELRLHIFEPRYKKLIRESLEENSGFGIPLLIQNKLQGSGAIVEIVRLDNTYENGEMDIVCKGKNRFEIVEFFPDKRETDAANAMVKILPFADNEDKELNLRIADLLNILMELNKMETPSIDSSVFSFYKWVHKCGLSTEKELEMVQLESTYERQRYMLEHLKILVNSQEELLRMKNMILLNGHFKKLNQSF